MQPPPTRSEIKTHLLGRLEALLDDCDQVADQSKFGHTFNNLEKFFRTKGQNFLQETLELKLQERIDLAESTVEGKQCPECKKKTTSVNRKPKTLFSTFGGLRIFRRRRECATCGSSSFPVEVTLGLPERYSDDLKERVAHNIATSAYRPAGNTLKLYLNLDFSPTTIGEIADEAASEMEARLHSNPDVRKDFQAAKGETEFQIDGTCINTRNEDGTQEYRDVKIASAVKRERGDSATPSEWATRELPEPNAVYAVAAIEDRRQIADGRRQQSRRLRRLYPAVCRLPSAVSYWHGAGIGVIEEGIETGGTYAGGFIA